MRKLSRVRCGGETSRLLERCGLSRRTRGFPNACSGKVRRGTVLVLTVVTGPSICVVSRPFVKLSPGTVGLFLRSVRERERENTNVLVSARMLSATRGIYDDFLVIRSNRLGTSNSLSSVERRYNLLTNSLCSYFRRVTRKGSGRG